MLVQCQHTAWHTAWHTTETQTQDTAFVLNCRKTRKKMQTPVASLSHQLLGNLFELKAGLGILCSKSISHLSSLGHMPWQGRDGDFSILRYLCLLPHVLPFLLSCPLEKNQVSQVSWPMSCVPRPPHVHAVTMCMIIPWDTSGPAKTQ